MSAQSIKKRLFIRAFIAMVWGLPPLSWSAMAKASTGQLCAPLKVFATSVKAGETKKMEFHTSWGTGFKDSKDREIASKRCIHNGDAAAKVLCGYLMEHGHIEFSDVEATQAIECLSAGTRFGSSVRLDNIAVELSYGTEQRGSNVTIQYDRDSKLGGMVLSIEAAGY